MSEADISEEPKRELVEPSFDDKMDVEVEGEALPSEQGKSGSQMASADHVAGELKGKLELKDANVELTVADEVGDGTVSRNLRKGNEDHDVTYKAGDAVENRGLPSTKEDIGNDLGSVQAENGGQVLDTKENEVQSCENQIGDTLVNENVSGDAQVENGEQIMVVEEKEVQFEENQTRDISVKSEENQIGDVSVKSKENQMTGIQSKVKEKQSQDTSVNHKENPNGDTLLKPQENQMGDTRVKSKAKQNGEASVMSEENQIRDVSMKSTENQIADASVKLEDKHFEDALPKRKEIHFDHALIKKDTVNGEGSKQPLVLYSRKAEGDDSGTEEEQAAFMKELQNFYKERSMDFKPPKFYGEGLNCLKLWRAVTRLGGYEQVTSCKLWRQVGESFKPPKTCTTVSWTFRCFYEKALLEYEKHKIQTGELEVSVSALPEPVSVENQVGICQASGSGRARRDAAARAMQGWHSQRLLGNGEVSDPIIKDKSSISFVKRDKQLKSVGIFKRKKSSSFERPVKAARVNTEKPQMDNMVVDVGPPAEWVKINVRRTKDCFEIYALVPGLLREEVHVQSDPAGRLVISGEPEQVDNPWGVTPFKKIVTLPSRIDPHQTSAIVTLHGQLFVRAPFEQPGLS